MTDRTEILDRVIELARTIRPRWDVPGLRAAIREALLRDVQPTTAQLAYAVIHCAENPIVQSPAIIPLDGPHWRDTTTRGEGEPQRAIRCGDCHGIHMPDAPCESRPSDDHAHHIAQMRQIARAAKRPPRVDVPETEEAEA